MSVSPASPIVTNTPPVQILSEAMCALVPMASSTSTATELDVTMSTSATQSDHDATAWDTVSTILEHTLANASQDIMAMELQAALVIYLFHLLLHFFFQCREIFIYQNNDNLDILFFYHFFYYKNMDKTISSGFKLIKNRFLKVCK